MAKYVAVCPRMWRYGQILSDTTKHVAVWPSIWRYDKVWSGMSKYAAKKPSSVVAGLVCLTMLPL
jgi:hypothetical protein